MVTTAGSTLSGIGTSLKNANLPLVPSSAQSGLGGVVENLGATVSALGAGVQDGLGSIGSNPNPIGTTVASTGNVVTGVGNTVTSAGTLVGGLGTGQLSPIAPSPRRWLVPSPRSARPSPAPARHWGRPCRPGRWNSSRSN